MRILVLIPAFNEAGSLPGVIAELRQRVAPSDILVVDDGSTDGTASLLPTLGVCWVRLAQRLGTGAAVRTGLRYALSRGYDTVVRIDGDGQHPAEEIDRLLGPLQHGSADAVVGSRYARSPLDIPLGPRRLSHGLLGTLLSVLTGRRVTDPTSGLWAFGPTALRLLVEHHPSGYPEPELVLFLSRNKLRFLEVPVRMRERSAGRTSLTPPRIGAALARLLLLIVVVPLRAAVGTR
jgi:glycosyltransferase involved in cell wall biosynthesis